MKNDGFPIRRPYELGRLSQAGDEITIEPTAEERAAIAKWAGVDGIDAFVAVIDLRKISPTRFAFDARLSANVVQSCVVTLEPVTAHIERSFARELILTTSVARVARPVDIEVAPVDEDGREEIADLRYDLAIPILEELALSIDPYPRAPGVAFEAPRDDTDSPDRPFAALKGMKTGSKS
jgi:hypothetical protein